MNVFVVNGPNLNLLGTREPEIYGTDTLADLERRWRRHGARIGIGVRSFQSNHEGEIIDKLHTDGMRSDGVVLNAGAFSHTSYAIHDALVAIGTPTVEVHISDIHRREPWRATSVTAPAAVLTIFGRGPVGYLNALDHLWARFTSPADIVSYGDRADQEMDVRCPTEPRGMVLLIHGGFWHEVWGRDVMDPLAVRLAADGWMTVNVEYRRGPGSFEDSASDITDALDAAIATVSQRGHPDLPIVLVGHSAGGYLALREAQRRSRRVAAVGLAPVIDLESIAAARADDDPVATYLGADAATDPDLWRSAAIAHTAPSVGLVLHGSDDDAVPVAHSEAYATHHNGIDFRRLDGVDHMSLIDPSQDCHDEVTSAIERAAVMLS
jgi:3-dehydroquinate dehydratase-2